MGLEKVRQVMDTLALQFKGPLETLFERWQAEKQYEDWVEYAAALRRIGEEATLGGVAFLEVTKRPFGITMKFDRFKIKFSVTSVKFVVTAESTKPAG